MTENANGFWKRALGFFALAPLMSFSSTVFQVAPNGSDANSGTAEHPFAR
jgi:hypothetical protein